MPEQSMKIRNNNQKSKIKWNISLKINILRKY